MSDCQTPTATENYVLETPTKYFDEQNYSNEIGAQTLEQQPIITDFSEPTSIEIPTTYQDLQQLLQSPKYTQLPASVQFIVKSNLVKAFNNYSSDTRSKAVEQHLFDCIPDTTYVEWISLLHKYARCCPHLEQHKSLNVHFICFVLEYLCTYILPFKQRTENQGWQCFVDEIYQAINEYVQNDETYDVQLLRTFQQYLTVEQMQQINQITEHQVMDTIKSYRDNIYKIVQTVTYRFDILRLTDELQAKQQEEEQTIKTSKSIEEITHIVVDLKNKLSKSIQCFHLQAFQFDTMTIEEAATFMRKMEHTFMELFQGFVQCEEDTYFDADRAKMKEIQDQSLNNLDEFLFDIMKDADANHSNKN